MELEKHRCVRILVFPSLLRADSVHFSLSRGFDAPGMKEVVVSPTGADCLNIPLCEVLIKSLPIVNACVLSGPERSLLPAHF